MEKFIGRLLRCSAVTLVLCLSINIALAKPFAQKEKFRAETETEDSIEVREEHPEQEQSSFSLSGLVPAEYINYPILIYEFSYIIDASSSSIYTVLLFPSLLNIPPPSYKA
ncbi:hypothetical protein LEP1GSC050_3885 [Leptospira broomii serovar Hurstbridge str. 5399]|uniref:Lipoprotein n=1 Tax=Leptospira broomii serovar Hurstbridge str. 5399 TaxID=1049789 RepID=T0FDR1_9LEPT|nr:hypothetical protein [Leptospira broomii]EQA45742.1 hypothetical protein LEP1GSC050_3885 [Leptospira broomii serovar Hurstbridge str. 5399]